MAGTKLSESELVRTMRTRRSERPGTGIARSFYPPTEPPTAEGEVHDGGPVLYSRTARDLRDLVSKTARIG